jgi:hypothetical protein
VLLGDVGAPDLLLVGFVVVGLEGALIGVLNVAGGVSVVPSTSAIAVSPGWFVVKFHLWKSNEDETYSETSA